MVLYIFVTEACTKQTIHNQCSLYIVYFIFTYLVCVSLNGNENITIDNNEYIAIPNITVES